jgi:hypothetical protein
MFIKKIILLFITKYCRLLLVTKIYILFQHEWLSKFQKHYHIQQQHTEYMNKIVKGKSNYIVE